MLLRYNAHVCISLLRTYSIYMSTFSEQPKPKVKRLNDSSWVSDDAVASLQMERTVNPTETEADLALRLFREALPHAAQSIIHMSQHAVSEANRYKAAQYVIERNLGKIVEPVLAHNQEDPFAAMVNRMMEDAAKEAKAITHPDTNTDTKEF